ncbi:MAG: S4 domain-containing protein, partial [Acidobacteriota bacterium]
MIRRFQVGAPSAGTRLDLFIVSTCSDLSRARIQKLIEEGAVRLSGAPAKRSHLVRAGDEV